MTAVADDRRPMRLLTRRTVSLAALGVGILVLFLVAPTVPLVVFAGFLMAVLISASGSWLAKRLGISRGFGIAVFLLLTVLALAGFVTAFVPAILKQTNDFVEQLPAAIEALRNLFADVPWLEQALSGAASGESGALVMDAVGVTAGSLSNIVIVLFIGVVGALDPGVYRRGLLSLLAPSLQQRASEVMERVGEAVRSWLTAQLIAMAFVGVLTSLGLWAIGVPLALLLGFIAGLLAFIPNLGPIIGAAPALLLALPEGGQAVLLVAGVFVTVQSLESYVVTPLLQQRTVSLPPALIVGVQLLMGILFGLIGLVLATPLAAVMMTMVKEIYVDDYLEKEKQTNGSHDQPTG